tara:strand:- start:702 stop:923 length:222 start_codon:yes stop_codon:yes gene_type:complete
LSKLSLQKDDYVLLGSIGRARERVCSSSKEDEFLEKGRLGIGALERLALLQSSLFLTIRPGFGLPWRQRESEA